MSISLSHVTYLYEPGTPMEVKSVDDVSVEIRPGEFTGLIGHTGSGKSTMIQLMDGLLRPSGGTVAFNGKDIFGEGFDRRALRGRVGLVFQYPEYQLFETDVFTDVCFGPRNQGLSEEKIRANARAALNAVGLDEAYDKRSPFELSGGEKRRVAIAGVLAMDPEIMILDEPTAGLDPVGREEILSCLDRLKKERGMGILLVSHSMEDVARYADRILVLKSRKLILDGSPKEVFRHRAELENVGLAIPQVCRIMSALKERGFDVDTDALSVDAACDSILQVFRG